MITTETVYNKSPLSSLSFEDSMLHLTAEQQKLYQCIEENRTEEAMEIFGLSSLGMSDENIKSSVYNKANDEGSEIETYHWSMMQWACFHGNEKIVQELLKCTSKGKDHNRGGFTSSSNYFTPLHIAAQRNHIIICWLLLLPRNVLSLSDAPQKQSVGDKDYDNIVMILDQVDKWGNTPLHTAAANGYDKLVKWFLAVGADRKIKNMFHLTPFDVASNDLCRSLLRKKDSIEDGNDHCTRQSMAKMMLTKYIELKTKLIALVNTGINDATESLNQIQQLIADASEFGLPKDIIDHGSIQLQWLKLRRDVLIHMDEVKSNSPIVTVAKYEYVNDLQQIINGVSERGRVVTTLEESKRPLSKEGRLLLKPTSSLSPSPSPPVEIQNLLTKALALCDRSTAEYNLNKSCQQCEKISCANEHHKDMMLILENTIATAKEEHSDQVLIENANSVHARLKSELALKAAKGSIPNPRLPVPDMTNKQAKNYWREEDVGHVKETEGYPLPPPDNDGAYVWIQSEALQSLQKSLDHLESCINDSEECGANIELIDSCKALLREKRAVELKALLEKDESDRLVALAITEKAAKKLMKKKKKGAKK